MRTVRKSDPVPLIHQTGGIVDQLSTANREQPDRLFERSAVAKQANTQSKRKSEYVSNLINVQSLLNIRAMESRQRRRNNSASFQDRIIINVCGDRYETHRTTLELYPETLLGNRKRRKYYYDKTRNEYFFDRNRACFEAILYYYQSNGRLRRPNYVPIDTFLEEITFFQLGEEALIQLRKDENLKEVKKVHLPKNRIRRHLWATMEYPNYSLLAQIVNIVSLLMIFISTISLAIETLPQYVELDQMSCRKIQDTLDNATTSDSYNASYICNDYFKSPFFTVQTICVAFFTIELLLRIISAPSLFTFIKNLMNWVDVLAVLPYYITIIIRLVDHEYQIHSSTYVGLRLLRIVRCIRILKFYRVFKNVKSLRVLAATVKESIPDFFIMIIILTLLSFLFGAAAYFAENETNGVAFDSILKATYWGIMTISSVGYGDIYPITPIGRVISCVCALFGAATIGMLVSVLVDRYQRVFARKLYINDETIDFHDYSDEEGNDTDSRVGGRSSTGHLRARYNNKDIEDPDARAKENAAFEADGQNTTDTIERSNEQIGNEDTLSRHSSRVHFIIGYVDDKNHDTSRDLLDTIGSVVANKQASGESIQLNIIEDKQQQHRLSPYNVQFSISPSSGENSDNDEELTEIVNGRGSKGNVLKKFQAPPSPMINTKSTRVERLV